MWIARDKNGTLLVFRDFPKRHINEKTWHRPNNSMVLYNEDYPQYQSLKWEDEPIEVELKDCFNLYEEAIAYAKEMNKRNIDKIIRKLEARIYAEQKRPNWKDFLYKHIQDGYYDIFIKGVNMIKKKLGWES